MRNSTAMLKYNIIVGGKFSFNGESVMASLVIQHPYVTILCKASHNLLPKIMLELLYWATIEQND